MAALLIVISFIWGLVLTVCGIIMIAAVAWGMPYIQCFWSLLFFALAAMFFVPQKVYRLAEMHVTAFVLSVILSIYGIAGLVMLGFLASMTSEFGPSGIDIEFVFLLGSFTALPSGILLFFRALKGRARSRMG